MKLGRFFSIIRSRLFNRDIPNDDYSCLIEKEPQVDDSLPKSIIFIIGVEFSERFTYYGLKSVLALYLTSELLFTEDSATSLYHGWSFSCYFTTIFGAILADSFLGRYRTIFYLSIVHLTGSSLLSIAATKPIVSNILGKTTISIIGLLLIAVGTGGIKPCVSPFGEDQLSLPQHEHLLSKYFSVFYFSINSGSLLTTIITPILRENVTCFGGNCFPLAFGIPALLMLVALGLFLIGTPMYRVKPSQGTVITDTVKCIIFAGVRKLSSKFSASKKREINGPSHWLDLAEGKVPSSLIKDVKILLNVLVLFLPLPFFWALFDQQGSRWTFQATKMSGKIGSWTLKPDQMQTANPLLFMILIPIFEFIVYPTLSKCRILTKPLRRMFVGGLITSMAFVISGILQIQIEVTSIHMLWLLPQYLVMCIGEVMFLIPGLEFSITQAPPNMKCVVQACWLMTVAFGNLIVVFFAEIKLIKTQSLEFFFFAGLMFLDMLLFLFLVRRFDKRTSLENNADTL